MDLNQAIKELTDLRDKRGIPGDTEILDPDGFAVSSFEPRTFEAGEEREAAELECKVGDTIIETNSLR